VDIIVVTQPKKWKTVVAALGDLASRTLVVLQDADFAFTSEEPIPISKKVTKITIANALPSAEEEYTAVFKSKPTAAALAAITAESGELARFAAQGADVVRTSDAAAAALANAADPSEIIFVVGHSDDNGSVVFPDGKLLSIKDTKSRASVVYLSCTSLCDAPSGSSPTTMQLVTTKAISSTWAVAIVRAAIQHQRTDKDATLFSVLLTLQNGESTSAVPRTKHKVSPPSGISGKVEKQRRSTGAPVAAVRIAATNVFILQPADTELAFADQLPLLNRKAI